MRLEPGEIMPPHKYNISTQLVEIIGGRYRENGRFFGFGHRFMIPRGETHSYDNFGPDVPLHTLSVGIPEFSKEDIEFV